MLSARSRIAPAAKVFRRGLSSAADGELSLLRELLMKAEAREAEAKRAAAAAAAAEGGGNRFQIQTFNAISPSGLERFPGSSFMLTGSSGKVPEGTEEEPHAILLRSHKLKPEEVSPSVRAIARCGAGTNNVPIADMTERGVPVFNTPGANANSVKELVLCGLLLSSRGILEGVHHVNTKIVPEEKGDHKAIAARIEKDKKHFGGQELLGKTLGICGLGNIGALVAESALALGMKVVGHDPKLSVEAAWRLSSQVGRCDSLDEVFAQSDYVSINMPYIKGVTHHAISAEVLSKMKPTCNILNFARGEILDGDALVAMYKNGHKGKYICDFADEFMQNDPNFICIPHLGASTEEAEDNCAAMAANQVINFLETGTIINSVNFPNAILDSQGQRFTRLCIVNKNQPGVLGEITTLLGEKKVNIAQQLNTSRDTIAYNVLDLDGFPEGQFAEDLQAALVGIDGVISTRLIWTGSAQEGPSNFVTTAGA